VITIVFIIGIPKKLKQHDAIMDVFDQLRNVVHFIPIKYRREAIKIIEIFMREILKFHRIPTTIILDKHPKFTWISLKGLLECLGAQLNFSIDYHPQIDGYTKRTNQIHEYLLYMHVMSKPTKWEDYLHLLDFPYNNGYHAWLKMSLFEEIYGRRCNNQVI